MAQTLTFDEAYKTWQAMTALDEQEATHDFDLLDACETLILDYSIGSHAHASAVCAVIAYGCDGGRSDGRDKTALQRLSIWLDLMAIGAARTAFEEGAIRKAGS